MGKADFPQANADLFVARGVHVGGGLVIDALVVYALGLLFAVWGVDEVYG